MNSYPGVSMKLTAPFFAPSAASWKRYVPTPPAPLTGIDPRLTSFSGFTPPSEMQRALPNPFTRATKTW